MRSVAAVVHAGDLRARVDLRLGGRIGLGGVDGSAVRAHGGTVPVEVIVGQVEADARVGRDLAEPVQLEAGELHHQHVVALRVPERVEHRHPDVAHGCRAQAAGEQHVRRQLRRGGLAVGAGDADPVGDPRRLVAQAPTELDVAPDGDPLLLRPGGERMVGPVPRGDDHEFGIEVDELGQLCIIVGQAGALRADHLEQALPIGIGSAVDHAHAGSELHQGVRHREARHPQSEHRDAQPRPVVMPARQCGRTLSRGRTPLLHLRAPFVAGHCCSSHSP